MWIQESIQRAYSTFLAVLFPKRCVSCGAFGVYICPSCFSSIPRIDTFTQVCPECKKPAVSGATHPRCKKKYSLSGMVTAFPYRGVVTKAIKEIKYRGTYAIIDTCMPFLVRAMRNAGISIDASWCVVPVPLSKKRKRERGFNQAEMIAKGIASAFSIPLYANALQRIRDTSPQADITIPQKRQENVKEAFRSQGDQYVGKHVLLVDDVTTTGATFHACVAPLIRSGAVSVWGIALARS